MTNKHKPNKSSDRISTKKGKSLSLSVIEKYGIKGETYTDQLENLFQYLLLGEHAEVIEECSCEGCYWYLGWNSKQNKPACGRPKSNLQIDKGLLDIPILNRQVGKMCRKADEDTIEAQRLLGKNVTRKNLGIVLTMAKKLNTMDSELSAVRNERQFLKTEVARINRDLHSERVSGTEIDILKKNIASKQLETQALKEQVSALENRVAEFMGYDLKVDCPQTGESIWFFKECLLCIKESDCWRECESYRKLVINGVSV